MNYRDVRWQDDAACLGMDTNLFFTLPNGKPKPVVVETCARCTVQEECLSFSVKHDEYGVWAGLSRSDRKGTECDSQ